jgi:5-methylcytosine-specific restriction endonuclease McrA
MMMSVSHANDILKKLVADVKLKPEVKAWFLMFGLNDVNVAAYRNRVRDYTEPSDMDMFLERYGISNLGDVRRRKCMGGCTRMLVDAVPRVRGTCKSCNDKVCAVKHWLKYEYWVANNGNSSTAGCKCCGVIIESNSYSAAHVIAAVYGGEATVANIRTTCFSCNGAMGSTHLDRYSRELVRIRGLLATNIAFTAAVEVRWAILSSKIQRTLSF